MYFMDCHCHIGVDGHLQDPRLLMDKLLQDPRTASPGFFNVMSTYHVDLEFLVALIDMDHEHILVPHFGIHPWYSHLFSSNCSMSKVEHYNLVLGCPSEELLEVLPEPIYIEDHIEKIIRLIHKCKKLKKSYAIGEIGLDKVFRVPSSGYYGNREFKSGITLTINKVLINHQKLIFQRQLELANEVKKPVSLHCVKAHGPFFDILHSSFLDIPSITLHSYTGSSDQAKRWIKAFKKQKRQLHFSFSSYINGDTDKHSSLAELIHLLSDDQILYETDMPIDRYFLNNREDEYFDQLRLIQKHICDIKGISETDCNALVERNSRKLHDL